MTRVHQCCRQAEHHFHRFAKSKRKTLIENRLFNLGPEHFRQVGDTKLEAIDDGRLSHPALAGGNGLIENR